MPTSILRASVRARTFTKRRLVIVAGLASWLAWVPLLSAEIQTNDEALVKIFSRSFDGKTRRGSGFVVAIEGEATYVVTAAHVVAGDPQPQVRFAVDLDRTFAARTVRTHKGLDLALLQLDRRVGGTFVLAFDDRRLQALEVVRVAGFPHDARQPHWISAHVAQAAELLTLSQASSEATSGSPVLRDRWVVGLLSTTLDRSSHAVPATLLLPVLKSWNIPLRGARDDLYSRPGLISSVADGELDEIADDQETRLWIFSYLSVLSKDCQIVSSNVHMPAVRYVDYEGYKNPEAILTTGWKMFYDMLVAAREFDYERLAEIEKRRDPRVEIAVRDAVTFVERHGCSSARVRQFRDSVVAIVTRRSGRAPAAGRAATWEPEVASIPRTGALDPPPRLLRESTRFTTNSQRRFGYEAKLGPLAPDGDPDSENRLSAVADRLTGLQYKCLASLEVRVTSGVERMMRFEHYGGRQLYLFLCSGACDDLVYEVRPERELTMLHYGTQLDFPAVLVVDETMIQRTDRLTFRKPATPSGASTQATVSVLDWSDRKGDLGPGCGGFV